MIFGLGQSESNSWLLILSKEAGCFCGHEPSPRLEPGDGLGQGRYGVREWRRHLWRWKQGTGLGFWETSSVPSGPVRRPNPAMEVRGCPGGISGATHRKRCQRSWGAGEARVMGEGGSGWGSKGERPRFLHFLDLLCSKSLWSECVCPPNETYMLKSQHPKVMVQEAGGT